MNWELFAAFCVAAAVLGLIPGPAVGAITATGLAHGTRAALGTVLGGMMAIAFQMTLIVAFTASFLGLLGEWMPVIRWAGVGYLTYLGIETVRHAGKAPPATAVEAPSYFGFVLRGFVVNGTNPKALGFYAAFFPQFIDASLPLAPQVMLMAAAYFMVLLVVDSTWALIGGHANAFLRSERARTWRDRASGGALLGAAAGLASIRTG